MKIVILNGSPRKNGNTFHAVEALKEGLLEKNPGCEVEIINAAYLNLKGCFACDECMKNGGTCVIPDGGADIIAKAIAADLIVFASPVYWWGISGQLKVLLDRFYSKDQQLHSKTRKIGVIAVGGAETSDPEYKLISDQFQCICDFLGWKKILDLSICAGGVRDLAENSAKLAEIRNAAPVLS